MVEPQEIVIKFTIQPNIQIDFPPTSAKKGPNSKYESLAHDTIKLDPELVDKAVKKAIDRGRMRRIEVNAGVVIDYANPEGDREERIILPRKWFFGSTVSYIDDGNQWILEAWDIGSDEIRPFALQYIRSWRPYQPK